VGAKAIEIGQHKGDRADQKIRRVFVTGVVNGSGMV
jgi:hypothetical protein